MKENWQLALNVIYDDDYDHDHDDDYDYDARELSKVRHYQI